MPEAEPSPMDELVHLHKVQYRPFAMTCPSQALLLQLRHALRIPYDWPTAEDLQQAQSTAIRVAAQRWRNRQTAKPASPILDEPEAPSVQLDEVRVREGKRPFHESLLKGWGLPLPDLSTGNPGVHSMRIKNACLHALTKGHKVP